MKAELIITGTVAPIESLEAIADRLAAAHGYFSTEAIRARSKVLRGSSDAPEVDELAEQSDALPLDASDTIKAARGRLRALQRKADRAIKVHGFFSASAIRPRVQGYYLEARIAASLAIGCAS